MKWAYLICAAAIAASPALARDTKKKAPPAPPPAPVVEFELDDPSLAEPLSSACLANPAEIETYDSRDNVMIARIDGGRAFFHLKGKCTPNVMIFADSVTAENGGACVKPGESLVFKSSYGDAVKCEVTGINRWLEDEPITDE